MAYQPIENYGVVGNMRTVALIGMDGSVDWACAPRFDSPSMFGAILDDQKGGYFKIGPADHDGITYKQLYWPGTNVLVTRFLSPDGVAEIIDFMPVNYHGHDHEVDQLIRRVNIVRGSMALRLESFPAFNYARDSHEIHFNEAGCRFSSGTANMQLSTTVPLRQEGNGVTCDFVLHEGQTVTVSVAQIEEDCDECYQFSEEESRHLFEDTVQFWREWLSQSTYRGRWREMVERSALVLKLLTYEPTGAMVASPTCSLPEGIGGLRNWDYRYTCIRDAAFTIYGLLRIGFTEEAAKFMGWIEARAAELDPDGSLQNMYGIDGRHELAEERLDHLDGYRGSRPVRAGNSTYNQLRLDIYGELMDAVYLYNKYGSPISYDFWSHLSQLTEWVVDNWQRTDEGMWEVRGGQQHFVYSKLMCWVALDRAIKLADNRSFPADRGRWQQVRDQI
ncbi:MAG: glycoside hydrolase family 15 protein, partial [Dehalococcoidia bacterium]